MRPIQLAMLPLALALTFIPLATMPIAPAHADRGDWLAPRVEKRANKFKSSHPLPLAGKGKAHEVIGEYMHHRGTLKGLPGHVDDGYDSLPWSIVRKWNPETKDKKAHHETAAQMSFAEDGSAVITK